MLEQIIINITNLHINILFDKSFDKSTDKSSITETEQYILQKENEILQQSLQLKPASSEQLEIVNALETTNIISQSVAGSGKTTTILHIV